MAEVASVNISERKGTVKHEVDSIELVVEHGIVGDAHAGNWHRQISLLAEESIDKMRALGVELIHGAFAENINTVGIDLKSQPIGTKLAIGECVVRVTQIGKECHNDCEIKKITGKCVMPTEGIFAVVEKGGTVHKGDKITVLEGDK
ncbi:MAG: MOSC domain-containing protein [Clostridiales bacterium]|nr:MOSC domain-containing protein [Clostridiales bacterium]